MSASISRKINIQPTMNHRDYYLSTLTLVLKNETTQIFVQENFSIFRKCTINRKEDEEA